jgi:hypothetical protein
MGTSIFFPCSVGQEEGALLLPPGLITVQVAAAAVLF